MVVSQIGGQLIEMADAILWSVEKSQPFFCLGEGSILSLAEQTLLKNSGLLYSYVFQPTTKATVDFEISEVFFHIKMYAEN